MKNKKSEPRCGNSDPVHPQQKRKRKKSSSGLTTIPNSLRPGLIYDVYARVSASQLASLHRPFLSQRSFVVFPSPSTRNGMLGTWVLHHPALTPPPPRSKQAPANISISYIRTHVTQLFVPDDFRCRARLEPSSRYCS